MEEWEFNPSPHNCDTPPPFDDKTKYQLQFCKFRLAFWSWKGRGVNLRKTWGYCRHTLIKLFMVAKKKMTEKKNTHGKKKYRCSPKGVSECGKKNTAGKKKYRCPAKGVSEWLYYLFQGKKIRDLWSCLYRQFKFLYRLTICLHRY